MAAPVVAPLKTLAASAEGTIYTCGTHAMRIKKVVVCNRGVAGTVDLYLRPLGAALDSTVHSLLYQIPIAANDTLDWSDNGTNQDNGTPMFNTDVLSCKASHANMTVTAVLEPFQTSQV